MVTRTTVPVLVSKIMWCRYNFPEIKRPDLEICGWPTLAAGYNPVFSLNPILS
jgi:hypothetical protein